jgi:hypothetical protein
MHPYKNEANGWLIEDFRAAFFQNPQSEQPGTQIRHKKTCYLNSFIIKITGLMINGPEKAPAVGYGSYYC